MDPLARVPGAWPRHVPETGEAIPRPKHRPLGPIPVMLLAITTLLVTAEPEPDDGYPPPPDEDA